VGWKAIAGHLGVSDRTAIRWAELYGMPITRVPRGSRPLVSGSPEELTAWLRHSPGAAAAMAEQTGHPTRDREEDPQGLPGEAVNGPIRLPEKPTSPDSVARRWLTRRVLVAALLSTMAAGGMAALGWRLGFRVGAMPVQAPAIAAVSRAHGDAISSKLVELRLIPRGQAAFVVRIIEGEMARFDANGISLGLHAKFDAGHLMVYVSQIARAGGGESLQHVETRRLAAGEAVPVRLRGTEFELLWPGGISSADVPELPRRPCCLVCETFTVCGRAVAAPCGACEGESLQGFDRR
jgi:hypothetical protein